LEDSALSLPPPRQGGLKIAQRFIAGIPETKKSSLVP
jgi:hypothetical protein